jgi:hypothetical protein
MVAGMNEPDDAAEEILRSVAWTKEPVVGLEFVEVTLTIGMTFGWLAASGVAIAAEPIPYRLDYELATDSSFVTTRLLLTTRGEGWRRSLDLRRSEEGLWTAETGDEGYTRLPSPGGDMALLRKALDCDIQLSPLTNSMPVLRHDMLAGGSAHEFLMAWVALPALSVTPSRQRYVPLGSLPDGGRLIRYESLDSAFVAELTFDADGLVIDYPKLGRRLG